MNNNHFRARGEFTYPQGEICNESVARCHGLGMRTVEGFGQHRAGRRMQEFIVTLAGVGHRCCVRMIAWLIVRALAIWLAIIV